jgi:hypothetical protein
MDDTLNPSFSRMPMVDDNALEKSKSFKRMRFF